MTLRGVLDYSFNNILCLRGFAPLADLAKVSVTDENYQRKEIKSHTDDITRFLDNGGYTFFPEVILGGSFESMDVSWDAMDAFYDAFNKKLAFKSREKDHWGNVAAAISVKTFKDENGRDLHIITGSFSKLKAGVFSRIDGNHRLQAVEQAKVKVKEYNTPFCLVLFRTDEECRRFGRVFFHMINFRAKPISEDQNLKLIIEENDFSDEQLLLPPFGLDFAALRMCRRRGILCADKQLMWPSYSTLRKVYQDLLPQDEECTDIEGNDVDVLTEKLRKKADAFFKKFEKCVERIGEILADNAALRDLCASYDSVIAAMLSISFRDESAFPEFIAWLTNGNRCQDMKRMSIPFREIIKMFYMRRKERERTIFVSMRFGSCGTEQNFKTISKVVKDINKVYMLNPELKIVRVDQIVKGETFEINEQVINQVSQCGYLIADLTYCNSNVYHEIGMLMGRTLTLTGKHEYNMALILDKQVSEENKIVKFNLKSLQHFAFSNQKELATGIRERIEKFYRL